MPADLPPGLTVNRVAVSNAGWDKVALPPVSDGDHLVLWTGVNEIAHKITQMIAKRGDAAGIASIFSVVNARVNAYFSKIEACVKGKAVKVLVCSPYGFVHTPGAARNRFTQTFYTTDSADKHRSIASLIVGSMLYNAQEKGFDFLDCTAGELDKSNIGRGATSAEAYFAATDTLKAQHAKIAKWIADKAAAAAAASAAAAPAAPAAAAAAAQ